MTIFKLLPENFHDLAQMSQTGEKLEISSSNASGYSEILLASDLVTIGHFHLPQNSQDFHTAGAISAPTLVFPRTQMWIEKQNSKRYLSHPNLVNF